MKKLTKEERQKIDSMLQFYTDDERYTVFSVDEFDDFYEHSGDLDYLLKNYKDGLINAFSDYYDLNRHFLLQDVEELGVKLPKGSLLEQADKMQEIKDSARFIFSNVIGYKCLHKLSLGLIDIQAQLVSLDDLIGTSEKLGLSISFHDDKHLVFR